MIIFPIKAIDRIIPNAVPDQAANLSPTYPIMTGNPAANPTPNNPMDITIIGLFTAKTSKTAPRSAVTVETYIALLPETFFNRIPNDILPIVNTKTYK